MPVGLNIAQLNRISDPSDPYNLDSAMAEGAAAAIAPQHPPIFSDDPVVAIPKGGATAGAQFAPSSIRPITERILTPADREKRTVASGGLQGRAGTTQIIPDRPGDLQKIEASQRASRRRK